VVHLRIDSNSVFGGITPNLLNQEKFNKHQVSIPIHENLSDEEINLVVKSIKSGF
jgi:dTDP-4-amino-4,6-dideoxygalactose transaminase